MKKLYKAVAAWYMANLWSIIWFMVGVSVSSAIDELIRGNYGMAGAMAILAVWNYAAGVMVRPPCCPPTDKKE